MSPVHTPQRLIIEAHHLQEDGHLVPVPLRVEKSFKSSTGLALPEPAIVVIITFYLELTSTARGEVLSSKRFSAQLRYYSYLDVSELI